MIYQCKCTNNKSLSTNGDEQRSLSRESDDHQLAGPGFILSYNNNYLLYFFITLPVSTFELSPAWLSKSIYKRHCCQHCIKEIKCAVLKNLFTLSQILKQHHWQPVPNDEMTSPYSWVIIRKIVPVWIFHRWPGFTDLILAFYLSLKELSLLPLSVERLESSIPRSWQMSVVFLHFCTSGFKPCLGICFLCIAYDNVVQLPGKSICSGAKSPSSPEGAFSEAPVFTLFFLLDKTVFLDLTNQSRHFYSDQMRVDTEGWLRRNLEVWSGPVLACRPPWQRWLAWQ